MESAAKTPAPALRVRILLCASCGGPLPAPTAPGAGYCRYCKAPAANAIEKTAFTHDVQVLLCDHCLAPLPAPIGGGLIQCDYCSATSQVLPRQEKKLGTGNPEHDEAARLERLRAQDNGPLIPPSELRHLMHMGGLTFDTEDEALAMWQSTRKELAAALASKAPYAHIEERFYFLIELLSDHYAIDRKDRLRARGLFETSLRSLHNPKYIQIVYCGMARQASVLQDRAAADTWLALADPAPEDLQMDSAVRFTRAFIAMRDQDFAGVLHHFKRTRAQLPLSDHLDNVATMYRAHAIEKLEGTEAGAQSLMHDLEDDYDWNRALSIAKGNLELRLCASSIPIATRRVYSWRKTTIFGIAALIVGTLILGDTLGIWNSALEDATIPAWIAWAILLVLPAVRSARRTLSMRRPLTELEAKLAQ